MPIFEVNKPNSPQRNSYNKVVIGLTTHDVQTVTGKDIALAIAIEQLWRMHYT